MSVFDVGVCSNGTVSESVGDNHSGLSVLELPGEKDTTSHSTQLPPQLSVWYEDDVDTHPMRGRR